MRAGTTTLTTWLQRKRRGWSTSPTSQSFPAAGTRSRTAQGDRPPLQPPADCDRNCPQDLDSPESPRKPRSRVMVRCSCPDARRFPVTPSVLNRGPITCGICGQPFTRALAE